ncbi:glycosyltransferase family 4 protein [Algoriphagus sp. H41]|uniref:Glycosyltransferase family 4 protein n=1 Tax=Algoriphagus oliviformis TaxID=2811231 RepID=A0ABS3C743_9BACT|nr:glycosyltransferase family 4 protein [Algoriphagus oliviformis]MBN7811434.1 glycosyltransferase family 4 protein [Algoriphagus oliviformis]
MIIYTFPIRTAFIDRDLEMISPKAKIRPLVFTNQPAKLPFYFILQFFQLLWLLPKTDQYLCFFGGYHAVLPVWFGRAFGKRCTIQAGGMDCMNMPEIGYGNFRKKWLRKATVYSFKNCSLILPVAEALLKQDYRYDPKINPKQGLQNLIPDLTTPTQVVPNGFDTSFWKNLGKARTPLSFVSVATGTSNASRAQVKGYDLIEQLAQAHPDWTFTLIGDANYSSPEANVRILGKVDAAQLRDQYNRHQFYLQLSASEGFPNALGEAMACGCIPIGSAVGAIPEIIGACGLILETKDSALLDLKVVELLSEDLQQLSSLASLRIGYQFSFQRRQNLLFSNLGLLQEK